MLFDLRSRGRRRTVQAVYLGLAILMGGGLVLFGVGTGNGIGGLLDALTGQGSSGAQKQVISQQEKQALKATQQNPNDPQAWASLVQARWTSAGQGSNYDTATASFTTSGKKELTNAVDAWQQYLKLTKQPDPNVSILAARAYSALNNYSGAAQAWEYEANASPSVPKWYECLAASAYAAGQTRKGDLATAKALALLPKGTTQTQAKTTLAAAKSSPQTAQQIAKSC
jgi:tetratricopeptide (TPR) repeat protein